MELVHIYCALKSVQKTLRKLAFDDATPLSGAAEWFPSTTCLHRVYKALPLLLPHLVTGTPFPSGIKLYKIPEKQIYFTSMSLHRLLSCLQRLFHFYWSETLLLTPTHP